jgi:hypothetical protein
MKRKPLVFTVLSILCLIEPVIKVLYFRATTQFEFAVIFANLQSRNSFLDVVDFWLVFPVAGLLILRLRKWTYFAFLGVLSYILYNITTYEKYTWPYNAETPFAYNYVIAGLSLAVFAFFLLPQTRQIFFDRRVRWWEPHTRYNVNIPCKLHGVHLTFPTQVLNVSRSGAFLEESPYLKVGEKLTLEFNFLGQQVEVDMVVVHRSIIRGQAGFGVRFLFSNVGQSLRMARVVAAIRKSQGLLQGSGTKELKLAA